MSGFAGIVNSDGAPVDEILLRSLADRLAFRGPDAVVVKTLEGAGFCFTLLRTGPAPQAEELPLTLDRRQYLVGDVRLDGRDDLRGALTQAGYEIPSSATDEELALRAWQLRGTDSGSLLMGDYSFAVWEPGAKRLVCVRDAIGVRPFFYAVAGSMLCFSNTLEALRIVPSLDLRLDDQFVGDFLLQGCCSDLERTVHRGIRRLKPGHLLEFRDGVVSSRRFVELPIQEPLTYRRPNEYVEHFQSLFQSAVLERVPRDRVAYFMSGGLDSTSVAATAMQGVRAAGSRVSSRAYTVDFHLIFDDKEADFAKKAAEYFDVPITVVSVGEERPFDCWTDGSLRFPEPVSEPFQSAHVKMCREVSTFARVGLSGDGGDDILSGKAGAYALYLLRRGRLLELSEAFGRFLWQKKRVPVLGTGLRGRWRRWRRGETNKAALPSWLKPEFVRRMGLRDRLADLPRVHYAHSFHPRGYASLSQGYWASVQEDDDAGKTGVPLERRSPFLSRRLIEFLLRVPPVPWCMEKELLRVTMRGMLPEEIRTRAKTPLLKDPLVEQANRLRWRPLPLPAQHPILDEFVDWAKLETTLLRASGSQLWDDLRPISLNNWVKGVENGKLIL